MVADPEVTRLLGFVRRSVAKRARIGADTPLFETRLVDSMNILRLIGYLEKRRGRRLRSDEIVMSNFRTVRTMAERFLHERTPERG